MASLAAIFRQVEREGARWGLVPIMRDGKVAVAEMVSEIATRPAGSVVAPSRAPRVICSLDENSPMDAFSMILRNRIQRHNHDFAKLVLASRAKQARRDMAELEDRKRDLRAQWERRIIRGRITSMPAIAR
jgi:hypothetical protein